MNGVSKLLFASVALMLISTGCTTVYSPQVVGDEVVDLSKYPKLEGVWRHFDNEEGVTLSFADAKNGIAEITYKEDGKIQQQKIYFRKSAGWFIVSCEDEKKKGHYLWARIKDLDEPALVFWGPSADKFKEFLKAKQVKGKVLDKYTLLVEIDDAKMKEFEAGKHGVIFEWEEPLILFKK